MKNITSPSREERDYEIIVDKISRLSLEEDLPSDNPIIKTTTSYYLIADKIVERTRKIIVS